MRGYLQWVRDNPKLSGSLVAIIAIIVGMFGWEFVVRFAGPNEKPGVVITLPASKGVDAAANEAAPEPVATGK
jgi:hypothetical protein